MKRYTTNVPKHIDRKALPLDSGDLRNIREFREKNHRKERIANKINRNFAAYLREEELEEQYFDAILSR